MSARSSFLLNDVMHLGGKNAYYDLKYGFEFCECILGGGPHEREFCYCLEVDSKSFGVF